MLSLILLSQWNQLRLIFLTFHMRQILFSLIIHLLNQAFPHSYTAAWMILLTAWGNIKLLVLPIYWFVWLSHVLAPNFQRSWNGSKLADSLSAVLLVGLKNNNKKSTENVAVKRMCWCNSSIQQESTNLLQYFLRK